MNVGRSASPMLISRVGSRSRFVVVTAVGTAIAVASMMVASRELERVPTALAFVLLFLSTFAAQRESIFVDETALSGSVVVITAAIVGFGSDSALVPVLCAIGAAIHIAHVRQREFFKMLVNMGSMAGPAMVASELFRSAKSDGGLLSISLAILVAVSTYWVLNNLLVGFALAFVQMRAPKMFAWELVRSESVMLVFAIGGALCGLVMVEVGQWTGIAALVALLVALDVFVISVSAGPATLRSAWKMLVSRVAGAAMGGVVGAALPKLVASAVVGALLGGVVGLAAGLATVALVALVRLRVSRTRLERSVLLGFIVAEITLPAIGTVGGVVGAFAGLGPAIATTAGLVVIASMVALWLRHASAGEAIDDDLLLAAVTEAMFDGLPHPANRE